MTTELIRREARRLSLHSARSLALLAALMIGGCASSPKVAVAVQGVLPEGQYTMVEGAAAGQDLTGHIASRLAEQGLIQAEPSSYFVQVSRAERSAGTEIRIPEQPDAQLSGGGVKPRKGSYIATAVMSISSSDGTEIYRATSSITHRRHADDAVWMKLMDGIFSVNSTALGNGP